MTDDETPVSEYKTRIIRTLHDCPDALATTVLRERVDAPGGAEHTHSTPFGTALHELFDDGVVALASADAWTIASDQYADDTRDAPPAVDTTAQADRPDWYESARHPPLDATVADGPLELVVYAHGGDDEYRRALAAHYAAGDDAAETLLRGLAREVELTYRVQPDGTVTLLSARDRAAENVLTALDSDDTHPDQ